MQMWTAYLVLALTFAGKAIAAGNAHGDHHASITDLVAPAVNVFIIASFLIWKLKGPLAEMFNKKAADVSSTIERANIKSKEAQVMLDAQTKKMSHLDQDVKEIFNSSEKEVQNFEKTLANETEEKTRKLKSDATLKIEASKKAMVEELNAEILDQVIAKTKSTIKTNKDFQAKASNKLLQGLQ
jgi:F0F1-type ATP synthase membrane subunit b/b'